MDEDEKREPASEQPKIDAARTIVGLLSEHRELYGLQLVHLSQGVLQRGSIYVLLTSMEERGLLASREEDAADPTIGLSRRLYRLQEAGRRACADDATEGVASTRLTPAT
jgi:DNA-binding PadR family transcriptional regulator